MHRLVVLIGLMLLFLKFDAAPTFACSLGDIPPTPLEHLLTSSVFVRATVIESSGNNHILAVDQYLIGSGPRILFLYQKSPADWALEHVRHYDVGCNFIGDVASLGTTGYFALDRQGTGTYRFHAGTPQVADGFFYIWQDGIHFWTVIDPAGDPEDYDNYESHTVSEAEFMALVAEMSGQEPSSPSVLPSPPRRKLLYITTESGQQYFVPVDGGTVVPVPEPSCGSNCPILSPDGTHMAQILDEDTIQFIYPGTEVGEGEDTQREIVIGGQTVMFSPDSNFALVWDNQQLRVYRFFADAERYGMNGLRMNAEQLWSVELATNDSISDVALRGKAVWSADSTTFAYVDASGIWRYDLFQGTDPQLVVPFEENLPALDMFELSSSGRYLRYGTATDWTLLEVETDFTYDNGLISPDELYLARFSLSGMQESQGQDCYLPIRPDCAISITIRDGFEVVNSEWFDVDTLLVVYCTVDSRRDCDIEHIEVSEMNVNLPRSPEWDPRDFHPAYDLDYDPQYGILAQVSLNSAIQFYSYSLIDETPHLSDLLDSPIASIEWGESLWYDDRR